MFKLRIMPYKTGSQSARLLRTQIPDALMVRTGTSSRYRGNRAHVVLNWGCKAFPASMDVTAPYRILNFPNSVSIAASKIATFKKLTENNVPCVKWTIDPSVARTWFNAPGVRVLARYSDTGSQGAGIKILKDINDLTNSPIAPLYTLYAKPIAEYRVHVFLDEVIDYTKKLFRRDEGRENHLIRSHNNGAFFTHQGLEPLAPPTIEACIAAINACGLDFGAIDVITTQNGPLILEINTAPGLDPNGLTLTRYKQKLEKVLINSIQGLEIHEQTPHIQEAASR